MSTPNNPKKGLPISIHKHNPFLSLRTELDRVLNDFPSLFSTPLFSSSHLIKEFENLSIMPAIDIINDKNEFKVEIEMPGMGEEDIKVSITDGVLTIKGEKSTSKKDKDRNYVSREIHYGCYERSISLPETVDVDKAKASFKKGMLWVTIPKQTESVKHNREITVEKIKD